MKNVLKKVNFKLEGFNIDSTDIINNHILIFDNNLNINSEEYDKYKIVNLLGKGTVGQVYMLDYVDSLPTMMNKPDQVHDKKYIIKISKSDYQEDLNDEVELVEHYFNKYDIEHASYPIFWGKFINMNASGVIYPYLGFYNLHEIKKVPYKIYWENNVSIIIQLINQLINFKNIIHGDLKSLNVVVDTIDDNIVATIIDFGLIKKKNSKENIISTNYITSPESLLSLKKYLICIDNNSLVDFSKHDYYGLYTIILDLLLKKKYWIIIKAYLVDYLKLNLNYIVKHKANDIYGYIYYKFFYNNHQTLPDNIYKKLIYSIEINYPTLSNKQFYDFDTFYKLYIEPNIDYTIFNSEYLPYFKDFLINICHFDPTKRMELKDLLLHPFLN